MKSDKIKKSLPGELLSGLIAFDEEGRTLWPLGDLELALRQQLQLPMAKLARRLNLGRSSVATQEQSLEGTLGDLLLREQTPSLETLRAVKDFAKHEVGSSRSNLPPDIALLLYYCTIITARLRCNERISRLNDDDLRRGLNWAARQLWLDPITRDLFLQGLIYLRSPRARWRRP